MYSNYDEFNGKTANNVLVAEIYDQSLLGSPKLQGLAQSSPFVPGRIRLVDVNQDGYPDAVVVLQFQPALGGNSYTSSQIWLNEENQETDDAGF